MQYNLPAMMRSDRPIRLLFGLLSALPLALLAGCMEPFEVPEATSADAQLYVRRCSLCHALPDPARMTYGQWVAVVGRMAQNIRSQNVPQVPDDEYQQILRYLQRHAKADAR
ncbi:MAG: hypothetical protein OEW11_08065 [Nitrospirota bacterium]|nr:hypothetical protein [Nitrospirota bacterium]